MTADIKPYPAYKDSGVSWLGPVPEHWETRRLKSLLGAPITDGPHVTPTFVSDGMPFLSVDGIQNGNLVFEKCRYVSPEDHVEFRKKTAPRRDDILLVKAASTGKIARVQVDFEFSIWSPLALIRPDHFQVLSPFLEYALKDFSSQAQIETLCTLNTQKNISMDDIPKVLLPLPPIAEQEVIVRYLDHADRKVRHAIRARQQLVKLLTEQKQAIIQRAVTRGLDPTVRLKPSGVPWLGDVPQHWEVRRLKTLSHMKSGESITSLEIDPTGDYPVYGGNGLRGYTSVYTHDGEYALIGRQGALCGNVHQARGRFWASEHAVVASLRDGYGLSWFCSLLDVMNLNQYSMAAAQPGLAVEQIINLWIPVPPADEQRQISDYLDAATMDLDRAIDAARHEISLLREYRTRLIADVVTGKLDVCDVQVPDDETDVLPEELENIDDVEAIDATDDAAETDSSSEERA